MSDFDKEAEREKLRKKYARDETKRANTQRMSELLLKGATMTNQHCNRCGDPLFRHNGQTFCARCQADANQQTAADADQQIAEATDSATAASDARRTPAGGNAGKPDAVDTASASSSTTEEPRTASAPSTSEGGSESTTPSERQPAPSSGDLMAARDSLARTVTRFAQQAERTEDPRRAREFLSAAREAAETLAALE